LPSAGSKPRLLARVDTGSTLRTVTLGSQSRGRKAMTFPSEHDFGLLLMQLFIVLSVALSLGELFRRWGQASVIGEVTAGILLGPSVLGALSPPLAASLFPVSQTQLLGTVAWLGSVFLLLVAGTEVELKTIRREWRAILWISLFSILAPFALGFSFAMWLSESYLPDPSRRILFALFLATALSISAIPLVAKILMDLKMLKTGLGQTVMGCAVINDLVGWMFFAILLTMITGGADGEASVAGVAVLTLGFSLVTLTLGKYLAQRLFVAFHRHDVPSEGVLGLAVLVGFFCAGVTQWIGIHAIFGAFLAGVMIGETGEIINHTRATLRNIAFYVFSPIFFASMGLRADFIAEFDWFLVAGAIVLSCIGKLSGATLGAVLARKTHIEALAIGFGLLPQGAMAMILAFLALQHGLISDAVFVALVLSAIATSVLAGPLIQWAARAIKRRAAEERRLEARL
jgi:Kef-type K+ transport system membrane component KefB